MGVSRSFGLVAKSCPTLVTPWAVAHQASLSMGFSRQEYWSGLPLSSPGDFPNPGIKSGSPALQADSLLTELRGKPSASAWLIIKVHLEVEVCPEPKELPNILLSRYRLWDIPKGEARLRTEHAPGQVCEELGSTWLLSRTRTQIP